MCYLQTQCCPWSSNTGINIIMYLVRNLWQACWTLPGLSSYRIPCLIRNLGFLQNLRPGCNKSFWNIHLHPLSCEQHMGTLSLPGWLLRTGRVLGRTGIPKLGLLKDAHWVTREGSWQTLPSPQVPPWKAPGNVLEQLLGQSSWKPPDRRAGEDTRQERCGLWEARAVLLCCNTISLQMVFQRILLSLHTPLEAGPSTPPHFHSPCPEPLCLSVYSSKKDLMVQNRRRGGSLAIQMAASHLYHKG